MIDNIPFKQEITEINSRGVLAVSNFLEATIHDGKNTIKVMNVVAMNRYRDYIENFTQTLTITVVTTLKEYEYLALSAKDNIKVTLVMHDILSAVPFSLQALRNSKEFTYKAKLIEVASTQLAQSNAAANSSQVGDLSIKRFSIQLIEPCFESVSIRTIGGVYRNTHGIGLMRTLLTLFSTQDDPDAITNLTGVDVVDGWNDTVREQIVVEHMTPLVKAINIINSATGGVYPTGFSFFLQSNLWYIFSPYDISRFNKTNRTLTVVNLPRDRLPTIEKTYFNSQTKLIVLSTRDATYVDNREANSFNDGTAVRFVEADVYNTGFAETKDNKIMVNSAKNVNSMCLAERSDPTQILRGTEIKITANKNIELSALAKKKGFFMQLIWENSDDSLLIPGMPTKILFLKDNKPASVTGILIEVETMWVPLEKNAKNIKLQKTTSLTFFVGDEKFVSG